MNTNRESDPLDRALGGIVRARRKRLAMSQSTLAEAIGVTFQQVQKYERGTNRISFSKLSHSAAALHCRPSELVAELDSPDAPLNTRGAAELLGTSGAVELLERYAQIQSKALRHAILDLSRTLAAEH